MGKRLASVFIDTLSIIAVILFGLAILFAMTDNVALASIFGSAALMTLGWLLVYVFLFKIIVGLIKKFWSLLKW